jgi:hypothetical protein
MKQMLCYTLVVVLMTGCGKKAAPQQMVLAIKEMQELATVEMTMTKIIKANDNKTWYTVGDRKILMSCKAIAKAGIKLDQLSSNQISITGTTISVQLPEPELLSLNIPAENIQLEYEDVDVLRSPFTSKERDALAVQAETQVKNSMANSGILQQAKLNTELFLSNFFHQMGYEKVLLSFDKKLNQPAAAL